MALDLLQNRDLKSPLGPFDGQVAAFAELGAEHYFVTTNMDYVPTLPSLQLPHALFLLADMRYGTDDPVPVASSSVASSSREVSRSNNQQLCFKPYPPKAPGKAAAKGPAKIAQDKFSYLAVEEMLPSIVAWADAPNTFLHLV
ncbi:hypothetical protein B0H10DRAFT_2232452 [Mycena sp. CBHHK59/15]|nr:hypothetical protein B0H10DRAFT_2232452 [Mycena sp. CBHHK59/15]